MGIPTPLDLRTALYRVLLVRLFGISMPINKRIRTSHWRRRHIRCLYGMIEVQPLRLNLVICSKIVRCGLLCIRLRHIHPLLVAGRVLYVAARERTQRTQLSSVYWLPSSSSSSQDSTSSEAHRGRSRRNPLPYDLISGSYNDTFPSFLLSFTLYCCGLLFWTNIFALQFSYQRSVS